MAIRTCEIDGKKTFEVYVNGFDARGVRVQRKRTRIETLRRAQVVEFELKRELAKLREEKVPFKWSEWFEECLKRMKLTQAPSTIENYNKQLRKWICPKWDDLELQQITKMKVYEAIFDDVDGGLAPRTRKSILQMTRRVFEMAVEEGFLDRNPCVGIQVKAPETEQKVLTNSEVEIFLREAKETRHRFYPIWALALMTGMRSGELFALKWTYIDFDGRIISVSKQWTNKNGFGPTKTQRCRVVPISDDLLTFLKEMKLKSEGDFVLPHYPEWENGSQAQVTKEFCEAIGVIPVKFHDLRATFITNLLARGESLARVMAIVGHSQIKTTNGYLRKAGVDVKGGTEKLGYRLPQDVAGAKILSLVK